MGGLKSKKDITAVLYEKAHPGLINVSFVKSEMVRFKEKINSVKYYQCTLYKNLKCENKYTFKN